MGVAFILSLLAVRENSDPNCFDDFEKKQARISNLQERKAKVSLAYQQTGTTLEGAITPFIYLTWRYARELRKRKISNIHRELASHRCYSRHQYHRDGKDI
jgi:hypothetical protein